jgi:hypothetical protein
MRSASLACLALVMLAEPASADACKDLAKTANSALSMDGLDEQTRSDLNELLKESQSGDPLRCEKATGSIFQSSPEGERGPGRPRKCRDEQSTV